MDTLLQALCQRKIITADQSAVVQCEHKLTGRAVESLLLDCGFVDLATQRSIAPKRRGVAALDAILDVELDAQNHMPDPQAIALLPENEARSLGVLPLTFDETSNTLVVAMSDSGNIVNRDRLKRLLTGVGIVIRQANAADLALTIDRCYGTRLSLDALLSNLAEPDNAPVVALVDAVLSDAIVRRASDIHLSPEEWFVRIRYRVDGVLQDSHCLHIRYWPAILVRLKVLCDMDIAETRAAQDGHVALRINKELVDFRVSSFPVRTGENIVVRVLDRRRGVRSLEELGLAGSQLNALVSLTHQPGGLVLVCGPTGSGKTTTLYAMLNALQSDAMNIMTLEDPIEYPMLRVRQTQVRPNSEFGFAQGIRGMLRQDPDVMMIGEIRDQDSCAMACRAAITGHKVFTSVHAFDCVSALLRLLELGASPAILASSVSAIVAQRLLRVSCSHCGLSACENRQLDPMQDDHGGNKGVHDNTPCEDKTSRQNQPVSGQDKCHYCKGSGFVGRTSILELLVVTPAMADCIIKKVSMHALQHQAEADGMIPLRKAALELVDKGITQHQEMERVLGSDIS